MSNASCLLGSPAAPESPWLHLALRGAPVAELAEPAEPGRRRHPLHAPDAFLLAWLALQGPTLRERLATLLWPESPRGAARAALRQRLHRLQRSLGRPAVAGSHTLALAPGVSHDLGPLSPVLGDLQPDGCEELAEWLHTLREAARVHHCHTLVLRMDALEREGQTTAALQLAEHWVAAEPLSEAAWRRLMRLHHQLGDRSAALAAFARCTRALANGLHTRPSAPTIELASLIEADFPLRLMTESTPREVARTPLPQACSVRAAAGLELR